MENKQEINISRSFSSIGHTNHVMHFVQDSFILHLYLQHIYRTLENSHQINFSDF